jgi:hypothetical protein
MVTEQGTDSDGGNFFIFLTRSDGGDIVTMARVFTCSVKGRGSEIEKRNF